MGETSKKAEPKQSLYEAIGRKVMSLAESQTWADVARASTQGASAGFADEAVGVLRANQSRLEREDKGEPKGSFGDDYRKYRDEERGEVAKGRERSPIASFTGNLVGGMASVPAAGIKGAAAVGAAAGLGSSDADLTKGEVAGAAKDTAIGGTIGALVGAAAQAIAKRVASGGKLKGKIGADDMPESMGPGSGKATAPSGTGKAPMKGELEWEGTPFAGDAAAGKVIKFTGAKTGKGGSGSEPPAEVVKMTERTKDKEALLEKVRGHEPSKLTPEQQAAQRKAQNEAILGRIKQHEPSNQQSASMSIDDIRKQNHLEREAKGPADALFQRSNFEQAAGIKFDRGPWAMFTAAKNAVRAADENPTLAARMRQELGEQEYDRIIKLGKSDWDSGEALPLVTDAALKRGALDYWRQVAEKTDSPFDKKQFESIMKEAARRGIKLDD